MKQNAAQIGCYYRLCMEKLKHIDFPDELCSDSFCQNRDHRIVIDFMYDKDNIITALRQAAEGNSGLVGNRGGRRIVVECNRYVRGRWRTCS